MEMITVNSRYTHVTSLKESSLKERSLVNRLLTLDDIKVLGVV